MKKSLITVAAIALFTVIGLGANSANAQAVNLIYIAPSVENLHMGDVTQKTGAEAINLGNYSTGLDVSATATNAVNAATIGVNGYQAGDFNNLDVEPNVSNLSIGDTTQIGTASVLSTGDIDFGSVNASATNVVNSTGVTVTVDQTQPVVDPYGGKG